jgi:glycosyltransferase involved in cell wall biosynthesis
MGGTGPMLDAVRAEGERLGIGDRLHLPGMVLGPRTAMAAMDVYVSVNVGPITGIAGLEAAAGGTPVVAVQALPEHRRGEADWIWSDPDPALVAQEAARLLADAGERAALAERQRAHVLAHHSAGAMARAYEALYARAGAESR